MTPAAFDEQVRDLARLNGVSENRAGELMALIGDTPELADDGRVIVRDLQGVEIAKLQFEFEE